MIKPITIDREAIYRLSDAAEATGLTTGALHAAIKAGELPATKRSRRTYLEGERLWRWMTGRPQSDEVRS